MWVIYERNEVKKQIRKAPRDVLVKYEAWKRIVELQGPLGLRAIKGFHDERLQGKWLGFRSSRLGIKWRVIYRYNEDELEIFVVEVNPHAY